VRLTYIKHLLDVVINENDNIDLKVRQYQDVRHCSSCDKVFHLMFMFIERCYNYQSRKPDCTQRLPTDLSVTNPVKSSRKDNAVSNEQTNRCSTLTNAIRLPKGTFHHHASSKNEGRYQ